VLISTHQVEEVEALLSDVIMLDEGRVALAISLEDIDRRFVALNHDPAAADAMAAAHPLLRYREQGRTTALFDGAPPEHITSLGQRVRPSLVDLFMALTRNPALNSKQA
jgi:ABC-2 type transport system ATP-binding protein